MFLRELTIENYKGFNGKHEITFDKNLCYFVGDNNTGKSTVFESVEFLKSGLPTTKKLDDVRSKSSSGELTVTAKFKGSIEDVISDFSQQKYLKYVVEEGGEQTLIAQRTSSVSKIKQMGKDVEINSKKVTLWNIETGQFENPSGIDAVFKTLFEAQFVWADTNPDDIADFGSTKICGRLLTAAIVDFFTTEQWDTFTKVHGETFQSGKNSLAARTKTLESRIQKIISEQHAPASIKFNFQLPDPSSFIKSGGINIDDGTDTSSKAKGTGMQRALALALIQLYADELCAHPEDPLKKKPLFLFIDEPETFLHPGAQTRFLEALNVTSKVQQVFVTTHSPYLLRTYDNKTHALYTFAKSGSNNLAKPSTALNLFGKSSPTWGEINYFAYGIPSVEFHNEIYGFIQAKAVLVDSKYERESEFDSFLVSKGLKQTKPWIKEKGGKAHAPQSRTLQTYIRNYIHHPENSNNAEYTADELSQSIQEMLALL